MWWLIVMYVVSFGTGCMIGSWLVVVWHERVLRHTNRRLREQLADSQQVDEWVRVLSDETGDVI